MDLLQGALLTGATATGVVVVERVRRRGSREAVREDVTRVGTEVAERVGKVVGFVGHAGGRVLGRSAEVADGLGDTTTRFVASAGRTVASGAGAAVGAYAGMVDRIVPKRHESTPAAPTEKRRAAGTAAPTKRRRAAA
jgi:hypothetical protein